jgi:hypothetical protein
MIAMKATGMTGGMIATTTGVMVVVTRTTTTATTTTARSLLHHHPQKGQPQWCISDRQPADQLHHWWSPSSQEQQTVAIKRKGIGQVNTETPQPLRWSEYPITFSRKDHWVHIPNHGTYPLVVNPIVDDVFLPKTSLMGVVA